MSFNFMAAITICSDFGAQKIKSGTVSTVSPSSELPDVQAGFRKGRGTRDQIANNCWIIEKARVPEKYLFLLY